MAQLIAALADLERLLTRTDAPDAQTQPAEHARFVLACRSQTIASIAEVVRLAASDTRLKDNAELGREFSQKLQELRRRAAAIQTTWRSDDITRDPGEYGRLTRAIARDYADFCRWGRLRLGAL